MHDRIKVVVTADLHYETAEAITSYLDWIENFRDPSATPNEPLPNDPEVFRFLPERFPGSRDLRIEHGWLFTGIGKFSRLSHQNGGVAQLQLTLELNPTRFLAHQPGDRTLTDLEALRAPDALIENRSAAEEAENEILDSNDNVLIGLTRLGGSAFDNRTERWRRVLDIYLGHIQTLIDAVLAPPRPDQMDPPTTGPGVRLDVRWMHAIVQQAEVYWEYQSIDALSVVGTIAGCMQSVAEEIRVTRYLSEPDLSEPESCSSERIDGATSVTFPLRNNIKAIIYAKTMDRIRIEVRYNRNLRQCFRNVANGPLGIAEILERARQDAADRLAVVFTTLRNLSITAEPDRAILVEFLAKLAAATQNDEGATRIVLTTLLNTNGISESVEGIPRGVIRRLRRLEVLERHRVRLQSDSRRATRFTLASRYRACLDIVLEALPEPELEDQS